MQKTKTNIAVLCCSIVCIIGTTYLTRFINHMDAVWLKIIAVVGIYLLIGLIALAAMKLTNMRIDIDLKKRRQYLIGCGLALALSLLIAFVPARCGFSLVGEHMRFSWFTLVYELLFCLLIVGPVEEFVFRMYLQDAFVGFCDKRKWMGVVIAAFLFGLWHIINGGLVQVFFTFGIGLVFGFAKYKIKDCGYVGVAVGHGIYDFLNVIVRMFVV